VCDATLKRFYVIHLFLPFLLVGLFLTHMFFLHEVGSNNPLGVEDYGDLIRFHPYYRLKDFLGILGVLGGLLMVVFFTPDIFRRPENFIPANPYQTPHHIEPEWYFLFAYTVLRSVSRKGAGVLALVFSVFILFLLVLRPKSFHIGLQFYPVSQIFFWVFVSRFFILTFIGMRPAERPYCELGHDAMLVYFRYFRFSWCLERIWDYLIVHIQFSSPTKNWGVLGIWPFNLWYHGRRELR
jgi:ubiquinol-cytochrome c reductase cytochrome b subunit